MNTILILKNSKIKQIAPDINQTYRKNNTLSSSNSSSSINSSKVSENNSTSPATMSANENMEQILQRLADLTAAVGALNTTVNNVVATQGNLQRQINETHPPPQNRWGCRKTSTPCRKIIPRQFRPTVSEIFLVLVHRTQNLHRCQKNLF